ncbi:MAG: hypothetical protein BGO37_08460 [Cellulomonas sp. 73-92]|uniref:hypothetical protein n=1 Tax=Cellulomonas sp. 73-92 TaxID=1895740 RepID=UPI000925FCA2|nr:hypothetical protein [Cellulomonas sp. 73-92]OJV84439.1 MAG: hypothetical protein BGO37_08460 [Cellulomonas sp. 73-92]
MNPAQAEAVAALLRRGLLVDDDDGPSLADVRRARVPLTDAEAVTVTVPLVETLDALHDAGLAYGPPRPDGVRFLPGGRPALVVPRRWADEPDDDVPGLLRTVLSVMTPPLRPADEADDGPDLRPVLEDLLVRGCRSGAEVARVCFGTVEPEAVRIPDAGALARASLLAPAARPAPGGGTALPGPTRRAARRRARRRAHVRTVAVVVVAIALVGGVLLRPVVDRAVAGQVEPSAGVDRAAAGQVGSSAAVAVDPVLDRTAPEAAAAALTRQRAALIGAGDAAALGAVDAAGSPALGADEDLVASLDGDRLEGLSVDVQESDLVAADPDEPAVSVTSATSPYRRVGESGTTTVPGATPRTVVLHLRWTDAGWRVWAVGEPTA